jgi:hypothetical protein
MCLDKDQLYKHHADSKAKREQYNKKVAKMVTSFDANFIDQFNTRKTTLSRLIKPAPNYRRSGEEHVRLL